MKLYVVIIVFLFCTFNYLNAQKKTILKSSPSELIVSFEFNKNTYESLNYNQKEYIQFHANETYLEKGAPGLPYYTFSIQIPSNKSAATFEIIDKETETISNVSVFPSKGNIKRNFHKDSIKPYFGSHYSENKNYPFYELLPNKPFVFRELIGQSFFLFPYQYNPITQQLIFNKKITVSIRYNSNEIQNKPNLTIGEYIIKDQFLNTPINQKRTPAQIEDGDLLIISNENYLNEINPLVAWKNQKGIRTKVLNIPTSKYTDLEIKDLIKKEYQLNSNLLYVLFVGEHSEIPSHSYGVIDGDENWSDSYYGQMTEDLYPELFIGRITGSNDEISSIVSKTINYEKKKTLGEWMTSSIGIGSNEGLNDGDNNEADWQHLRKIKESLKTIGYKNVYEFYDGSHGENDKNGNPSKSEVLTAINQGVGLINYTGHGDTQSIQTTGITNKDIESLENVGKLPFVVSVACNNGKFIGNKCISEAWMSGTKNKPLTGAIVACGSTILMDWAPPMKTQDEIVSLLAAPTSTKNSLGSLFYTSQIAMLQKYGDLGTTTMNTWLFFGDPTLEFSYQTAVQLSFTSTVQKASNQLKLNVRSTTENAQITVSYLNKFITKGTIKNGQCGINLPDSLLGKNVLLTGTKLNYIPLQQSILIQLPSQINLIKCEGESISYNNKTYSSKGYYTDTLKKNNTDSIINIHVIEYPSYKKYNIITIIKGDSVKIGSKFFLSDTLYSQVLKTINGCDSTISTKILIQLPVLINLTKCEGEIITYNKKTYSNKGDYIDTLKINNKDSIIYINIIEFPSYKIINSLSISKGDSINIAGKLFFSDTIYTQILKSINGCDSTITNKIKVNNKTTNKNEIALPTIKIYPTIVNDLLKITSLHSVLYSIKIIDQTGKIIIEESMNEKEIILDIHQLKNGTYFIHLTSNNENHIIKIVKI